MMRREHSAGLVGGLSEELVLQLLHADSAVIYVTGVVSAPY